MLTSDVENYPGFPEGIEGPDMMDKFRKQAERFGARFIEEDADAVDFSKKPFTVTSASGEHLAQSVILATGSSARWLGLESETRLRGRGVTACATCDGAFFRDMEVVVVGGGDTAMEEATFLTRYCSKVTVIHRRDELRASKIMQQRALDHPKIHFVWDSVIEEVLGTDKVEGVRLRNVKTGETSEFACQGMFLAIGHTPNTAFLQGHIELDDAGYILNQGPHETNTSVEGVFVAGDVFDHRYKQAITAAGSGCKAAIDAERWLEAQETPKVAVEEATTI